MKFLTLAVSLVFTLAFAMAFSSAPALAADPAVTDPDKYKVVLENDRVRVFDYRDHPGDRTKEHTHKDFVLYVVEPFKRKLTFPNGESKTRDFKAGEVIFMKAQTHIGENVGTHDTHAFIVELKELSH